MRTLMLALAAAGTAWGAGPPAQLTPEQARDLKSRPLLGVTERTLEIELRVHGPWHRQVETTADRLGDIYSARGEWAKEARCRRLVLIARRNLDGESHWRTVDARLELEEALAQDRRTAAQRDALRKAMALNRQVVALFGQAQWARAVELAKQALAIHKEVLGEMHREYCTSLYNLGSIYKEMGDHVAALPLLRRSLSLRKEVLGERHPDYATGLNGLGVLLKVMGEYKTALPLSVQAAALQKELLGEGHPDYANSLNNLAILHEAMGDHKSALPLHQRALELRGQVLGRRHPQYAQSLNNLAHLHSSMGDHKSALPLLQQAIALARVSVGERHPDHARCLNNLALLYEEMGDHQAALPLAKKAAETARMALGARHPDFATSLDTLAKIHHAMGDNEAALLLARQALAIRKAALGRRHPEYATSLDILFVLHRSMGDYEAGLPLIEELVARNKEVLGERHPNYATALSNLASFRSAMGDHKVALSLYKKALAIRRSVLGEKHPHFAASLNDLALLQQEMGNHEAALPLLKQALEVNELTMGRRHPHYTTILSNLAGGYLKLGRPGAALVLQEQAISLTRRQLVLDSAIQSERQQRAASQEFRHRLDLRLSMPEESADFSHNHVLWWKGSSFAAQQARRRFLLIQTNPNTRILAEALRDKTRSLALLSSRHDSASRKRAEELLLDKEDLESRLARLSAEFRLSVRPPSGEQFRSSLPAGTALVDFLVYTGLDPNKPVKGQEWTRLVSAWVVRPGVPTVRVDLGPLRPIEEGIASWRMALEKGRAEGDAPSRLRKAVWTSLEKHIAGAKLVLVSPDGPLGKLPFAALPGKKDGTFLLEDVPLAVVPVPQVLSQLLRPARGKPSLLALGGVDYGEGSGSWEALPATLPEARAASGLFATMFKEDATNLSSTKATKEAVQKALPRFRFVHLATHGYFAPPSMRSAEEVLEKRPVGLFSRDGVTGWDPALLSGLVFAGANRPNPDDDGLLKASEIAEMDLSGVELAVLSACQTGIGMEAAGEGMLGLQRAFALAGCKSVVSSLWSVHDAATSVLMERFYHHLWEKKLPKLAALRSAQIDVMHHPEWVEDRIRKLPAMRGPRSAGKAVERLIGGAKARRSPVAWWAAWQLSGDWR